MVGPRTISTVLLAGIVVFAAGIAPGAPDSKPSVKDDPLYKAGKVVVSKYSCDLCHGSDLKGQGDAQDITSKGDLRHYTSDTFATLMNKNIDWKGKKRSIPIAGKLKADEINAVYFYLSNQ